MSNYRKMLTVPPCALRGRAYENLRDYVSLFTTRRDWAEYALNQEWIRLYRMNTYGGGDWETVRSRFNLAYRMLTGLHRVPVPSGEPVRHDWMIARGDMFARIIARGSMRDAATRYGVSVSSVRAAIRLIRAALVRHFVDAVPVCRMFESAAAYIN